MKKFTKWIALLMAGLLLTASLIACESAYTGSDDEDEEDEEQSESDSSKYKNLTPEELGAALLEADKFTITAVIQDGGTSENINYTQTYSKYGDLMKSVVSITSEEYNTEHEAYADLKNDLVYTQEEGVWTTQTEETELSDMLESVLYSKWFFEHDNYPEFDAKADRNDIKADCIREIMSLGEGAQAEGYFSRKGSEYTISFTGTSEGGITQGCTITIRFTADKITLPEAEPPKTGEDAETPLPDEK